MGKKPPEQKFKTYRNKNRNFKLNICQLRLRFIIRQDKSSSNTIRYTHNNNTHNHYNLSGYIFVYRYIYIDRSMGCIIEKAILHVKSSNKHYTMTMIIIIYLLLL